MKKNDLKKRKKLFVGIVGIIILIIAAVIAFYFWKEYEKQQQIEIHTEKILDMHEKFSDAEKRDEKKEILNNLLIEFEAYQGTDKIIEQINREYENEIASMKQYFIDEYDKIISENVLDQVEKIGDKDVISTVKENLEAILQTIQEEKGFVCIDKEVTSYSELINERISKYDARIEEIKKKEIEEAKARTEEERRKKKKSERKRKKRQLKKQKRKEKWRR